MTIDEIKIGDYLAHKSNPLRSGYVRGIDPVGPHVRGGVLIS